MSTGKILVGVLAGLAAGTLLGVLFAPDKGSETRKKISNKSSDAIDELKDKFDAEKEEAGNLLQKGKKKMDEFNKDGKSLTS